MRFRIDGNSTCRDVQRTLVRRVCHWHIDTRHIDDRRTAESRRQAMRPNAIAFVDLAILGDDCARDERRTGGDAGCKTAGNSEADDRRDLFAYRMFEFGGEANRVARTPDDGSMRPGCDARLGGEARYRKDGAAFYMPN